MTEFVDDYIRSFGMSGLLLTEELKLVESSLNVTLGHTESESEQTERHYFPQFEEEVRLEASEMALHYEAFYCLEKSIRKLISEILRDAEGVDWWKSARIPPHISQEVSKRIQTELDGGVSQRSQEAIDYTTFGELAVIISSNWDVFGSIFRSQRAVSNVMSNLNLLRGPIAHCSPMTEDEVDRLKLAVKDWFRIMS